MARPCSICSSPDLASIDQALGSGISIAAIAGNFDISQDSLRRHKANHLIPAMKEVLQTDVELANVDPLKEMRSLYLQLKDHLEGAESDPDNWQAIRAFHSEARRDLELLAKLMGELDERPVINLAISQEWIQVRTAITLALEAHPEARAAVSEALAELEV